jgi:demethylmenaquinone methyltransferase / 2-methoxy-6-polyprenyl-1,4-benzoquinol methylase
MRDLFSTIAPRYDFITRVFSYGMDRRWKRLAVARAAIPREARVLDLACGTGDFAKLVLVRYPGARVVVADLTDRMLRLAGLANAICTDAVSLPFAPAIFDAVFIGYGLRNFRHLAEALAEVQRVLKPGGMLVSLDFFLPNSAWLRLIYLGYLYAQGAFWGLILHGRARIYTYIPDSLRGFLSAREFTTLLREIDFCAVTARTFVLGGISVHWAKREAANRDIQ